MIKKAPSVYVQEVAPDTWLTSDNLVPDDMEFQAELHRRLQGFVGCINNPQTRQRICQICEDFNRELVHKCPGYFGQFGFDAIWYENRKTYSIFRYAKNIRTLLACMGYMMYALDCPEDAETYSCSIGNFKVVDGRAIQLVDKK